MRKLSEIRPVYVGTILGYDIYIPDSYYNPLAYLKKGCPIWIKMNENEDCEVFIIQNENNVDNEIYNIIKILPRKRGIAFIPLSEQVKKDHNISVNDIFGLSTMAIDEDGNIQAIITFDEITDDKDSLMMSVVTYNEKQVLKDLLTHILSDNKTEVLKGRVIKYYPSEDEDLSKDLGFFQSDDEYSFFQII